MRPHSPAGTLNDLISAEVTSTQWLHRDTVAFLHQVVTAYKRRFGDVLTYKSTPIFGVEGQHKKVLGTYRRQGGDGLEHRITLAPWLCTDKTIPLMVAVALHEVVHLQQYEAGYETRSRYHNKNFRDTVASIGLPCDQFGAFCGVTTVFTSAAREVLLTQTEHPFPVRIDGTQLSKQLIELEGLVGDPAAQMKVFRAVAPQPEKKRVALTSWTCGCQKAWLPTKTQLHAFCSRCGLLFHPT